VLPTTGIHTGGAQCHAAKQLTFVQQQRSNPKAPLRMCRTQYPSVTRTTTAEPDHKAEHYCFGAGSERGT